MNEENLIPAPIDEKNISSDWIEDVFDRCVFGGSNSNVFTGFIKDCLVSAKFVDNILWWKVEQDFFNLGEEREQAFTELKKRLKEYEKEETPVVEKDYFYDKKLVISQHFFFVEE